MTEIDDQVRQLLRFRRAGPHVIEGGMPYLLRSWRYTARSVARGEAQEYHSYLNDMDGREIIHWLLESLPEVPESWRSEVEEIDQLIRPHLRSTADCIWGAEFAAKKNVNAETHWWYFNEPPVREEPWP